MTKRLKIISIILCILGFIIVLGYTGFRYYLTLPCPLSRPLRDEQTRLCYACDTQKKVQLDAASSVQFKDQCGICLERELDRYLGFFCVLKCPKNKPLRDFNDACHACDEVGGVHTGYTYEGACRVCAKWEFSHGFCFKKCSREKPFRDFNGKCLTKGDI